MYLVLASTLFKSVSMISNTLKTLYEIRDPSSSPLQLLLGSFTPALAKTLLHMVCGCSAMRSAAMVVKIYN